MQAMSDGKSDTEVEHALNQMIEIAPHLQHRLCTNPRPLIFLFSGCCKGDGLTLGYRTTSVAELGNAMIRCQVPGTAMCFSDLRRAITTAYSSRRRADPRWLLVLNGMHATIASTGLNLEANIIEILEKSTSQSKRMVTKVLEDESLVVVDRQRCYMIEASKCQCGHYAQQYTPTTKIGAYENLTAQGHLSIRIHENVILITDSRLNDTTMNAQYPQ
jgi:hypothetical protein